MNYISNFIYSFLGTYQEGPVSETDHSKIIGIALASLGLVAIAYLGCQRRSVVPKTLPPALDIPPLSANLFETFQSVYQNVKSKRCPSLDAFQEDTPLLQELLSRWTLDSALCFFDLLCFDIYHDWKQQGAEPEDLRRFCGLCRRLSQELVKCVDHPMNPQFFSVIPKLFESFAGKIPETVQPKFAFLLKVLSQPEQAVALGCSPVQWFGQNETLEGDRTRRKDVLSFLDFACEMHPEKLSFIRTTETDRSLSQKINDSMKTLQRTVKTYNIEQLDQYNLMSLIKQIVDQRLLQKKIPTHRLFRNIVHIYLAKESKYTKWIQRMLRDHLSDHFEQLLSQVFNRLEQSGRLGEINGERANCFADNEIYAIMSYLANECKSRDLHALEREIVEKLDHERASCKDPEIYASIFSDMVCLYQTIHDIRFLKDITKDQLAGRHIPDSLVERAFLPVIDSLQTDTSDSEILRSISSPQSPSTHLEEVSIDRKNKVKTRSGQAEKKEEKLEEPDILASRSTSPIEKPDFPTKNVSGREVIRHLLNNGFVIHRTTGSHYQMEHVRTQVQTTIPYHQSIKPGTLYSIRNAFYRSQGF